MINVYICLMCFVVACFFYFLEYNYAKTVICSPNMNISNLAYINISRDRCLWLARFFLITAIVLSVIEQVEFIKAG